MRARSSGIIADNLEDFLFQANLSTKDTQHSNTKSTEINFQLINLDFLSLNEDQDNYDSLSSNKKYVIKLTNSHQNVFHKHNKVHKSIIPLKLKRIVKKKRGLLSKLQTNVPNVIDTNSIKTDTIKILC